MTIRSQLVYFDGAGNRLVAGGAGDQWSADAIAISSSPNNGLENSAGELFASTLTGVAFNPGTGDLTLTSSGSGAPLVVTLATLAADKFLNSSSFDPLTNTLTLVMSDASTYTVNLADLVYSSVAASTTAIVSGDGSSASPLRADVKISATAGNALTVDATGLYVADFSLTAGSTPATTTETGLSTVIFGGTTATMGAPAGWYETPDGKRIPYYNPV